jgi:hypothetical protein
MVNSPSPSGDFSFSFTVQLTEMDRDHYPLTLPLTHFLFLWKKNTIYRGERKTFFGSGLFSELEPNGPICWTEPKLPTLYTILYTLSVLLHPREEEGQRELHGGGYYREYPAGALRQWFNCQQFPQGISFPPDLFLFFFFFLLLLLRIQYILFSLWNMLLGDVTSRWYSSASFSSSKSVSHLSDLI